MPPRPLPARARSSPPFGKRKARTAYKSFCKVLVSSAASGRLCGSTARRSLQECLDGLTQPIRRKFTLGALLTLL